MIGGGAKGQNEGCVEVWKVREIIQMMELWCSSVASKAENSPERVFFPTEQLIH
jgi:hypothetical protein